MSTGEVDNTEAPSSVDRFALDRFVTAQAFCFDRALDEIRAGRKRSHWMWFIFPQLRSLGRSPRARLYGIAGLEEAVAYLRHSLLGPRLEAAVAAVQGCPAASLHDLFGSPDDLKFRSSMTLFATVGPDGPWPSALERWCDGPDELTLRLLHDDEV